jgi:hypothetical protein
MASEAVKEFADAGDGACSATNGVPPIPEFTGFSGSLWEGRVPPRPLSTILSQLLRRYIFGNIRIAKGVD